MRAGGSCDRLRRRSTMLRATASHMSPPPECSQQRHHQSPPPSASAAAAASSISTSPPQTLLHGPGADPDPVGAAGLGLSPAEISFFKRTGYLVKRGLIPAETLAPFVDLFWAEAAPPCLDRSDPRTFVDLTTSRHGFAAGPPPQFGVEIEKQTGRRIRRSPDAVLPRPELGSIPGVNRPYPAGYRNGSIKWTDLGGSAEFNDATSAHPRVLSMVESFIGGPIKRPRRNRGL